MTLQIRQGSYQIEQNTNNVLGSVELENARLASDRLVTIAQNPQLGLLSEDSWEPFEQVITR